MHAIRIVLELLPITPKGTPAILESANVFVFMLTSSALLTQPGGAGELLCINPNTLRNQMRKLGIPFRKTDTGSR